MVANRTRFHRAAKPARVDISDAAKRRVQKLERSSVRALHELADDIRATFGIEIGLVLRKRLARSVHRLVREYRSILVL